MKQVTYKAGSEEITVSAQDAQNLCIGGGTLTLQEIDFFLHKCQSEKANPFLHEIYIFKYNVSPAQVVVTQELMLKRAREMDTFNGMSDGVFVIDASRQVVQRKGVFVCPGETVVGGWCNVRVKGIEAPFYEALPLQYYYQDNDMWRKMPGIMIRKVARVAALRAAFPSQCSSYVPEEMQSQPQIQNEFRYDADGNILGLKNAGNEVCENVESAQPTQPTQPVENVEQPVEQMESQQSANATARSGVAGNPEAVAKETKGQMTYSDALAHIGEYGPLAGMPFKDVQSNPAYASMLTMYANCMTGKDQSAAIAILNAQH